MLTDFFYRLLNRKTALGTLVHQVPISDVGWSDGKGSTNAGTIFVNGAETRAGIPVRASHQKITAGPTAHTAAHQSIVFLKSIGDPRYC